MADNAVGTDLRNIGLVLGGGFVIAVIGALFLLPGPFDSPQMEVYDDQWYPEDDGYDEWEDPTF